jgi:glycosyltransferase involved in cell wall biosynthesis
MKIAYIVNARIPTEKAHGYQIAKMCSEFARQGAEVTLYVPERKNTIGQDLFDYYGLNRNFSVVKVSCADFVRFAPLLGRLSFMFQTWVFARALGDIDIPKDTVIYTRDKSIASRYAFALYRTFYDAHNFPERRGEAFVQTLRGVTGIVCNSEGTAQEFISRGFSKVLVAHNAVDLTDFDIAEDRQTIRKRLELPLDMKLVTYVGHLYAWKGVDVLIESAEMSLGHKDTLFVIVGGTDKDIEKYRRIVETRGLSNVRLVGHRPKRDIPAYLRASDVLVIPNVPISRESSEYTSPIKLFEYMASGVPIVASDLPSLRAIVSEHEVSFVPPQDAQALSVAIQETIRAHVEAEVRATLARSLVERFSWSARAEAILNFLGK